MGIASPPKPPLPRRAKRESVPDGEGSTEGSPCGGGESVGSASFFVARSMVGSVRTRCPES
eukprot:7964925-Pyramimonas_sp.AAC.1